MKKFTIVSTDKSVCPDGVASIKERTYRQNYNNSDITKYLILHYERRERIPGHTMQSILVQSTILKGTFLCHWGKERIEGIGSSQEASRPGKNCSH
jgi:hypothetical protein